MSGASPPSNGRLAMLVAAVLAGVVLGGYLAGRVTTRPGATAPSPIGRSLAPTLSPATLPPATQRLAAARPAGPPLPAERGGPFGSRKTTGSHLVALTFDDGPDPSHTPQTLHLLRKHRVTATFCLVGVNVRAFPTLVRAIAADGHALCNHSWHHDLRLGSRPRAAIRADLVRTNDAIRRAVPGARIAYYRQPGGAWSKSVVAVARELGMTSLHWTVDPQDWRRPSAGSIAGTVNAGTRRGAIVLLHDAGGDRRGTVAALRSILPNLTRRFRLGALPTTRPPS
ncbi:polysaccharide deacetylase family protein [Actinomycetes bacterium KLBMP 9797]